MARYLAKNIVSSDIASNAAIQLSYAIGIPEPTSLYVYADGKVRTDIADWIKKNIDLTPLGIINQFDLFNMKLTETTNYGHFGRENLPWEKIDLTDKLGGL
jgi:S-adenosylmethionine synthetase